jgi:uncharacterized protein (DUF4415 family)
MTAKEKPMKPSWIDPDDAPELTEEVAARAQISIGGKIIREATGTLTKRGRPPVGEQPKQQVTLRLPAEVLAYFKAGGAGWQTRLGDVLARHAAEAKGKGQDPGR